LVWFGIRVGSRSWSDQASGITRIIESLYNRFPTIGVVFDGFSLPGDRDLQALDAHEYSKIIAVELDVVKTVIRELGAISNKIGIFNIVGSSIFDAVLWAQAIDAYISSYGTLQHKVGWLGGKPGIIHSNQTLLSYSNRYIWASIEDALVPRYVRMSAVSDIPRDSEQDISIYKRVNDYSEVGAGIRSVDNVAEIRPEFNNYRVEWEALFEDLVDLLQSPAASDGIRSLGRLKRKVRKAIWFVSETLNISNSV
jgi:hypothetical protein